MSKPAAALHKDGVVLLRNVLSDSTLDKARDIANTHFSELLRALLLQQVLRLQEGRPPMPTRFAELVERDGGRLDVRHAAGDDLFQTILDLAGPELRDVLVSALGSDCEVVAAGNVVAMSIQGWIEAGLAEDDEASDVVMADHLGAQAWHADGPHLFDADVQLPPHAMTVFFPLIDLTNDNGPTEFCHGSHVRGREYAGGESDAARATRIPLARAGDAIIFDYRVWHRGTPNHSLVDRPVLYMVVARKWWLDSRNYNQDTSLASIFSSSDAAQEARSGSTSTSHALHTQLQCVPLLRSRSDQGVQGSLSRRNDDAQQHQQSRRSTRSGKRVRE